MRGAVALGLTLVMTLLAAPAAGIAEARDLHEYWDGRCKDCHGDAGAFARATLRVEGGRLLGRHHGAELPTFLRQHYLTDELVEPVMQMLQAQATTPPLFKEKCAGCHGNAAEFARKALVLKDGVLVGRGSGRPVRDFLQNHGGLAADQVGPMVTTLQRVLGEVGSR
jgi:mono/diheme cytochrome c family protein